MHIPLVDLKAQYSSIKNEIDPAVQEVIEQTDFVSGNAIGRFEHHFAEYIGVQGTVGVASGTTALHLSLLACKIEPGDEIITTAHTFAATGEAIVHAGAKPIFVDIDPKTYLIDPKKVNEAISVKTKAIIPVHLYGLSADMNPLLAIAERYNLWIIEDAAQAHGARYHGKQCGSIGDLACFSFYPGKNLGAYGDAGAVTGNNQDLLAKVRKLHDHGRSGKYEHEIIGYGERLDTLQAAILEVKLKHLDDWNRQRCTRAAYYSEMLQGMDVILPYVPDGLTPVYHQYVIRTKKRDALLSYLKAHEIGAGIHYPIPLHQQAAFEKLGLGKTELPVTESIVKEILSLPIYPELSDFQIEYVVDTIKEFFKVNKKGDIQ